MLLHCNALLKQKFFPHAKIHLSTLATVLSMVGRWTLTWEKF